MRPADPKGSSTGIVVTILVETYDPQRENMDSASEFLSLINSITFP
jgi:hypothetical protein